MRRALHGCLNRRPAKLKADEPLVSFTFDDFPKTAYTVGAAIVEKFGGRATYYAAMSLSGSENHLGIQFDLDDLYALAARGHEIGNHSFSHVSARKCKPSHFLQDVHRCEEAFLNAKIQTWTRHFAYPYGETSIRMKGRLGAAMSSCRGTQPGWNGPMLDLNLLRANPLYGGVERREAVDYLIKENAKRAGWIIFYTHDVSESPSPYGCTPTLLEYVARRAAEHAYRSMPVGQVVKERLE